MKRYLSGAATRELDALRAALDARLAALEAALADPAQAGSLERLMLDLARVATTEAEAAAARACLEAQLKMQEQATALRETEQALEAERVAATALRRDLERLRSAFEAESGSVAQLRRDLETAHSASRGARDAATQVAGTTARLQHELAAVQNAATARIADLEEAADGLKAETARLHAELEASRHAAGAAEAEARARYEHARDEADRRIQDLEREVDERNREIKKRDERIAALEAVPPPPAPESRPGSPAEDRPVRRAQRITFQEAVEVLIDEGAAVLVNLSTCGAQVLSPRALRPNRVMRVQLAGGERPVSCNGSVVWARLEPTEGSLVYRAGMEFTAADEADVLAFLEEHSTQGLPPAS